MEGFSLKGKTKDFIDVTQLELIVHCPRYFHALDKIGVAERSRRNFIDHCILYMLSFIDEPQNESFLEYA